MKIRGRLIIAFLIITACPFILMSICANIILSNQITELADSYQAETSTLNVLMNPIHVLYTMTQKDYTHLVDIADTTPDKLADAKFLSEMNASLKKRDSFVILRKSGKDYYVGDEKTYQSMDALPGFSESYKGATNTIVIDSNIPGIVKSKDFYFSDKVQGQIFLVTKLTNILPAWARAIKQLILSLLVIIVATGILLVIWIYSSIVKPLNVLRIATMQIGAGHLDHAILVNSTDEIGELCRDFEEMRIRLKEMIESRIQYEEDTREMISSMAHDLQTPLTSIKGYTEGILDGVACTPQKQEKYLKTIYSKASDMSYLVDELSIFAKVEQNSLPYHFISLSLDSYFIDCLDELSLDLETRGFQLHYDNQCNKDIHVLADPEQLKRVIYNITGNAAKYLDKSKGDIHVTLSPMPEPDYRPPLYRQINDDGSDKEPLPEPEHYICIEIHDNGPGIVPDDLPYIFHRFYRADASRNSSKRGSGLGLSIVAKIIEDHGGKVWAESELGQGTSILFTLKQIKQ